jgi:hypothetical protein
MGKQRARATDGKGPTGNPAPRRSSGEGAGSALREMLRRQAQNPRPGATSANPAGARSSTATAKGKATR